LLTLLIKAQSITRHVPLLALRFITSVVPITVNVGRIINYLYCIMLLLVCTQGRNKPKRYCPAPKHNHCANFEGRRCSHSRPWCRIADPKKPRQKWELCNVPLCGEYHVAGLRAFDGFSWTIFLQNTFTLISRRTNICLVIMGKTNVF